MAAPPPTPKGAGLMPRLLFRGVLAAVPMTAACGLGDQPGASQSPTGTPFPTNQSALNSVAAAVALIGSQRFATVYAGVEIDVQSGVVIVWRKPSAEFDAEVAKQPWYG